MDIIGIKPATGYHESNFKKAIPCGCNTVVYLSLNFKLLAQHVMYILASEFFEKDDKHVFKARNSCCV